MRFGLQFVAKPSRRVTYLVECSANICYKITINANAPGKSGAFDRSMQHHLM